jgi:hypothetical protein
MRDTIQKCENFREVDGRQTSTQAALLQILISGGALTRADSDDCAS